MQTMILGLLLCSAAILQSGSCILYPYATGTGSIITSGLDYNNNFDCPMGKDFKFYGQTWDTLRASANGWVVMGLSNPGLCYIPYHSSGTDCLAPRSYVAHFWNDHHVGSSGQGTIYLRKVDATTEPGVQALITKDAARIGVTMVPDLMFIATWICVPGFSLGTGPRVSHQIVIGSDSNTNTTVTIFNYAQIGWGWSMHGGAAIQFHDGSSSYVPLSVSGSAAVQNMPLYSNVGVPGRIITLVSESTITAPTLTLATKKTCTLDMDNGQVTTFDGDTSLDTTLASRKYLFAKNAQVGYEENICKFMLRTTTDANGNPDVMRLSVFPHPGGNKSKYKRNLQYKFATGEWKARGHQNTGVFTPPYTETMTDSYGQSVEIHVDNDPCGCGFIIWTPDCDYRVRVDCNNEITLELLSDVYDGDLIGMCQDGDGDSANDDEPCEVQSGTVTDVALSCSCPLANGSSCNHFIRGL